MVSTSPGVELIFGRSIVPVIPLTAGSDNVVAAGKGMLVEALANCGTGVAPASPVGVGVGLGVAVGAGVDVGEAVGVGKGVAVGELAGVTLGAAVGVAVASRMGAVGLLEVPEHAASPTVRRVAATTRLPKARNARGVPKLNDMHPPHEKLEWRLVRCGRIALFLALRQDAEPGKRAEPAAPFLRTPAGGHS